MNLKKSLSIGSDFFFCNVLSLFSSKLKKFNRAMRFYLLLTLLFVVLSANSCKENDNSTSSIVLNANDFAEQFLYATRTDEDYSKYIDTLENIKIDSLKIQLDTDAKRLAFWIDIYNALVQVEGKENPEDYQNRDVFFNELKNNIGGVEVSLNDIENGILRGKEIIVPNKIVDEFKMDSLDYRIHFTLNCGATSCPPIAYYTPEDLESQLQTAEKHYITDGSKYIDSTNTVQISELFLWYEEDFGGQEQIIQLMKKHEVVPYDANPNIVYKKYDWSSNF